MIPASGGTYDTIVVGAGIAGLALARELRSGGLAPLVLERSRGVGGRCATRRVGGQPVDHGLPYLHGRWPRFLADCESVPEVTRVPDWPSKVEGDGEPCRPEAFSGTDHRVVFGEGVNRFARHLAHGLDVRLEAEIEALEWVSGAASGSDGYWSLRPGTGETLRARTLALAMPASSANGLLAGMSPLPDGIRALLPLLGMVRMLPSLAVIARYPAATPAPDWQASLPRGSRAIHTILHDSSKRAGSPRLTLVIQARPRFSSAHLGEAPESWTRALLDEAADLHGAWAARPEHVQSHRWGRARVAAGTELAGPIAIELDGGGMLGLAGDGFHHAGGAEGAYRSGIELAARILEGRPRTQER